MAQAPTLDVRFFAPPARFAGCVATVYRVQISLPPGEMVTDLLLPEWANLRFVSDCPQRLGSLGGVSLGEHGYFASGPSSRARSFSIDTARLWGIGLLPLGWATFMRAPASEFADTVLDGSTHPAFAHFAPLASALEAAEADDEAEFVTICQALDKLARPPRDEARIRAVQTAMADPFLVQVADCAAAAGLSVRTLERVCRQSFGFSPNVLLRRQRLVRTLAAFVVEKGKRWNEHLDRHYHDQSHFVREFHHFMGMSPTEYMALDHPIVASFMENRHRNWGRPVRPD